VIKEIKQLTLFEKGQNPPVNTFSATQVEFVIPTPTIITKRYPQPEATVQYLELKNNTNESLIENEILPEDFDEYDGADIWAQLTELKNNNEVINYSELKF